MFTRNYKYITNILQRNYHKEIYLIRHGETEWNKLGMIQSIEDIYLNKIGIEQSIITGKYLFNKRLDSGNFDIILSSCLNRCMQTSNLIANEINLDKSKIIYLNQLNNIDLGLISSGKSTNEMKKNYFYDDYFKLVENYKKKDRIEKKEMLDIEFSNILTDKYEIESIDSIKKRINYVANYAINCQYNKIIIVTHFGIIKWFNRIAVNTLENIKGDLSNGSNCNITYYTISNGKFRLIMGPSTHHFENIISK